MPLRRRPFRKDRLAKFVLGNAVSFGRGVEDVVHVALNKEANLYPRMRRMELGHISDRDGQRCAEDLTWAAAKTDDLVRRALAGLAAEFLLYARLPSEGSS